MISEKNLCKIRKMLQEHLPFGEVEVFNSAERVVLCFIIPEKGYQTRRTYITRAINASGVLEILDDFLTLNYVSRENWITTDVYELVYKATQPAQRFCGDYNTDISVSTRNNYLQIEILNSNIKKKGAKEKFYECVKGIDSELKRIAGTEKISVSISGGNGMYSGITLSYANDDYDDYDDDPVNPNWPSTTGNPSGSGRGNNPPGSKGR